MFLILSVEIVECNAAHNCSSQGVCGPDGACDCDPSFYGDNCTSKLRKICDEYLVHYKTNIFISNFFVAPCHYLFTCSDHGYCSNMGTCQCNEGFYGDSCSGKHDNFLLMFSFSRFLGFVKQSTLELQSIQIWQILQKYVKKNYLL